MDDARGFQIRPVAGRVTEAVAVLAASMGDGPVTRRHLPDPARRSRYQRALFTAAVRDVAAHGSAFVALDDTIRTGGATAPAGGGPAAVVGVVLALPPGRFPASPWRRLRMAPDLLRAASAARTSYPALLRSTVALRGTQPRSGSWWYLHTVAVHPGVRRRGVGTGLLRHVLGLVDETGLPCYVHAGSPAAAALYGRLGFTPVDAGAEVDGALMVRETPGSGVAP